MTYEQALAFLNSRISIGWKLGLDSMSQMLAELDNPHFKTKFVHIAGTNGKGSAAAMLASIFRAAGYKTGLYTSPHLLDVRERIRLNEEWISQNEFCVLAERVQPIIEKYNATYFEMITTLAFLYFAEAQTDIVFLEVGLGGRLDATNVVRPELSIITSISFDHTEYLGQTLPKIAGEKAGIIKSGCPCLVGEMMPEVMKVFDNIARIKKSPLHKVSEFGVYTIQKEALGRTTFCWRRTSAKIDHYVLGMNGSFQVANACLVIAACDILSSTDWMIKKEHIAAGLLHVSWPGRFQVVHHEPLIIFDVAHNVASVDQLVRLLRQFFSDKKIFFVFGILKDKDLRQMAHKIANIAYAIQPVEPESDRALPAQELRTRLQQHHVNIFPAAKVAQGLENIIPRLEKDSVLCVTGSHYVVGEAMAAIKGLTK